MAAKKIDRVSKKVNALPAKGLSSKHAKGIHGGATRGTEEWIGIQGWDWEVKRSAPRG